MGFVLTRPSTSGGGDIPGASIQGIIINPGNTEVVDSLLVATNISVKWIYTIMDNTATNNRVISGEVMANHQFGTTPNHNHYGIIGSTYIPHVVDVVINTGSLELEITNNSSFQVAVNAVRIDMLI